MMDACEKYDVLSVVFVDIVGYWYNFGNLVYALW